MSNRTIEYWCRIPIELEAIFQRFIVGFPATDFIHDAENVWEWFDGQTEDNRIGFNITRQWDEDHIPDEPVRLTLTLKDEFLTVDEIGRRLVKVLGVDIHTGNVRYLRGDEFAFDIDQTFLKR